MSAIITILIYLFIFLSIYNNIKKKGQKKDAPPVPNQTAQSPLNHAAAAHHPVPSAKPKQAEPTRHHASSKSSMSEHDESIHDNHFIPLSFSSGTYEGSLHADSYEGREVDGHDHGGIMAGDSPIFAESLDDRPLYTPDLSANGLLNAIVLSEVLGKPGGRMAGNPLPGTGE